MTSTVRFLQPLLEQNRSVPSLVSSLEASMTFLAMHICSSTVSWRVNHFVAKHMSINETQVKEDGRRKEGRRSIERGW